MAGIVVLVSGGGTTLQNLIDARRSGVMEQDIRLVVADRPCGALARAEEAGVATILIERKNLGESLSAAILEAIPPDTSLIVLGGFLSILTSPLLEAYAGRIINIHPSLLPRHGGAGMYGMRVHRAVLANGDSRSGCTVHYVDHGTDTGEIILQRRCPVLSADTPETLRRRVAELEAEAIVSGTKAALEAILGAGV